MRSLLIASLLFGSTDSALCEALCASAGDSGSGAMAVASETTPSEHGGCHGSGAPAPEPTPHHGKSEKPCRPGCCVSLTLASASPPPFPGQTAAAALEGDALAPDPIGWEAHPLLPFRGVAPPGALFRFRNRPLLI